MRPGQMDLFAEIRATPDQFDLFGQPITTITTTTVKPKPYRNPELAIYERIETIIQEIERLREVLIEAIPTRSCTKDVLERAAYDAGQWQLEARRIGKNLKWHFDFRRKSRS